MYYLRVDYLPGLLQRLLLLRREGGDLQLWRRGGVGRARGQVVAAAVAVVAAATAIGSARAAP